MILWTHIFWVSAQLVGVVGLLLRGACFHASASSLQFMQEKQKARIKNAGQAESTKKRKPALRPRYFIGFGALLTKWVWSVLTEDFRQPAQLSLDVVIPRQSHPHLLPREVTLHNSLVQVPSFVFDHSPLPLNC